LTTLNTEMQNSINYGNTQTFLTSMEKSWDSLHTKERQMAVLLIPSRKIKKPGSFENLPLSDLATTQQDRLAVLVKAKPAKLGSHAA